MYYVRLFLPILNKNVLFLDTAQDTLSNFLKHFFIGFRGVSIEVCSSHIGAVLVSISNRHFYFYLSRNNIKGGRCFLKFRVVVPVPSGHNFSDVEKDMMLCFASGKYFATSEIYTISDIRCLSKERISVATCLVYSYLLDAGNSYAKYFLEKINNLLPEEIIDRFICLVVSCYCHKVRNFQLRILGDGVLLAVNNFRKSVVKAFFISFTKSEDIYMAILNAKDEGFYYHSELYYSTQHFPVLLENVRSYLIKADSHNLCEIVSSFKSIDNNNYDNVFSSYAGCMNINA